jgi:threonine/homoserine/homoserine lactone efflux protein
VSSLSMSELLTAAAAIALNPVAVVAVILMLSGSASRKNAVWFVLGWMAGLLVVGAAVLLLGDAGSVGDSSTWVLLVKLALGLTLLGVAVWQWRRRPASAEEAEMPGWMRSLAGFSAGKSFVTAAVFAGVNPKTLALNVAGAIVIVEAELGAAAQAAVLALFVAVSSATVLAPLLYHVLAPGRAESRLAAAQRWLIANNKAITATVLLLLGIMLVASGAQGLVAN